MSRSSLLPFCQKTGILNRATNWQSGVREVLVCEGSGKGYHSYERVVARRPFARRALATAIAGSMMGFYAMPVLAAENDLMVNPNRTSPAVDEAQLDAALDALHIKKAVDKGIVEQSVLDDYAEQNLGSVTKNAAKNNTKNNVKNNSSNNTSKNAKADNRPSQDSLQQQALNVQQKGYQMLTPAQIERELAAVNAATQQQGGRGKYGDEFDAPTATLAAHTSPIGFDAALDAANLPAPTNLETLGLNDNADIMARPIDVSDAASTGRVDASADITQHNNPAQALAELNRRPDSALQAASERTNTLDPEDYLPNYEDSKDTQAVVNSLKQGSKPKPRARNKGSFIKRAYNRLFNGGYKALPHIETTVYLQQNSPNAQAKLIKADVDIQPINNIKAALDDTTVQSVSDFTAALPRLRQTALDAAKAVGYYDISLRLRQPDAQSIDVIIEKLGEPVRVEDHIVDVRGEGSEQAEFQALLQNLPPKEGDVFNHRVYKNSKAALETLSSTYGYFDQYWLNKSVDIILPDNTADVSLVYNTGERYQFDDVVFFTFDESTNTLTTDPEKLPVELSLLRQLYTFKEGDAFYRPDITKFSNDLAATRYFNTVNVESILPPDDSSATSTLAFDNRPSTDNPNDSDSDVANNSDTVNDNDNNGTLNALSRQDSRQDNVRTKDRRLAGDGDDDNNNNDDQDLDVNSKNKVNAEDIAPIDFEVDEETYEKLAAIKQKAERLSRLPSDRVLDEKSQATNSILGKISDSISQVAKKIFPDEKLLIADENFVPPTLEGRKTPIEVQQSKKVPLYVFVSADKPRDAQVGLGYGTDTGVRATGRIDYNLINRKGYQAGAEVAVSRINKNATVYGSRPWKHPLNDKLEARLTYEEELIDQGEGNFELSTKTLKSALARNIQSDSGWDRSYFVRYRLDELDTNVDEADFEDLPVRFMSSSPRQQALLLGYGMSKTTVDNATNPTRGYRQYYGIEAGADKLLSDTDLAIVRAGVSGLYSFGEDKKHQVLGSLNTGYIWADDFYDVPYKLRFFAGGDQSLRGYDYNSLSPIDKGYLTGGQILAVGSAEYNYEFKPGFRGAVFTDIGNAYDKDFNADTKVGVGFGIRWASPVGVVRVDVAAGVTEDDIPVRLHFFIGSPL